MLFNKILIIGLGLIGGSFAKALKKANCIGEISAIDFDLETIEAAKTDGVIDNGLNDLLFIEDEIKKFDLIVIATPLSAYEEIFDELSGLISSNTTVIDLGSIKDFKIDNLPKNFIPCHPIAGLENSGFEYSNADLFLDKKFIICRQNSSEKIIELAKKIGAKPEFLDARRHDEIYALVSHLPQFLSFLTKDFSPKNIKDDFFKNAFRLDNSNPEIWEDVFEMNERNLEKFYLKFFDNLEKNIKNPVFTNSGISTKFDEKFFEENFAEIFFRILVVESYLQIPEIKQFQTFAGSGFRDFTSITSLLNFDQKKLQNLIEKNQQKILKFFKTLN